MQQMKDIAVGMSLHVRCLDIKVNHIKTEDYSTKAKRPKNSRLKSSEFSNMLSWKIALKEFMILKKELI